MERYNNLICSNEMMNDVDCYVDERNKFNDYNKRSLNFVMEKPNSLLNFEKFVKEKVTRIIKVNLTTLKNTRQKRK